ncbi:Putative exonuclease [Acidilobus saccharovorans 345-15]|uniref:Putative exonuclease n=1 Tax=Acidilobus saccharovorans (strain DSM 16705 / JCM 18335 / VKM B-2471 / 345-15) TaxID=666510 RepID=D9Q0W3_ACIS3|nr:MBL fold metallo-hydrolase [Acidilobus saccharovorans]ADL18951.1 Putative exonuclease [Acidilobus saccharovorans 345-15]
MGSSDETPKVRILGSGREVGRAAIGVEHRGRMVLLDYGVNFDENEQPIYPLHVRPKDVEALVLTHSHLDHVGAAPALFISVKPRLLATPLTLDVTRLLLYDMIKLNGPNLIFDNSTVDDMLGVAESVDYERSFELDDFTLTLMSSGHIPGSASVLVDVNGRKVLYTSDMNTIETKLMNPHKLTGVKADAVIIESTYSTVTHPERENTEKEFYESVEDVVKRGGTVLVPAFSVARGQEIMCLLEEKGFGWPVWIDGMIRSVTDLYLAHSSFIKDPRLLAKALEDQKVVKGWGDRKKALKKPGVIISSAGMLKGGPSLYYYTRMVQNEKDAVFLVSYQAPGTPGRQALEEGVFFDGERKLPVKARLQIFDFSSHTDWKGVLQTLKSLAGVRKVILVHGEPQGQMRLASKIKDELGDVEVLVPQNGDEIPVD